MSFYTSMYVTSQQFTFSANSITYAECEKCNKIFPIKNFNSILETIFPVKIRISSREWVKIFIISVCKIK